MMSPSVLLANVNSPRCLPLVCEKVICLYPNYIFVCSFHLDKIILFLSDGPPTEKDEGFGAEVEILRVIREENAKLNNSVIIQTYGVGQNKG